MKTCPRCNTEKASVIASSPVKGAWELYHCPVCLFIWRSSEPESIIDPQKYNPSFKVDPADIPKAAHVPVIPPMRRK